MERWSHGGPMLHDRVPRSADLMAALAPAAIDILSASSHRELASRLEPFLRRSLDSHKRGASLFLENFSFSTRLEEAFVELRKRSRTLQFLMASEGASRLPGPKPSGLTVDHVPQLFWKELYEKLFADLMPGSRQDHARGFCSMTLIRLIEPQPWESAARELGLHAPTYRAAAQRITKKMNDLGTAETFVSLLCRVLEQKTDEPDLMNYGARRRLLTDFVICPDDWRIICWSTGREVGTGVRRYQASVWLWSRLTSSGFRSSRVLKTLGSVAQYRYRVEFLEKDLGMLKERILEYGAALLAEAETQSEHTSNGANLKRVLARSPNSPIRIDGKGRVSTDYQDITDEAWNRLALLLPGGSSKVGRRRNHRAIVNGILWKMSSGVPWRFIPKRYGPWKTCYYRYASWRRDGTWQSMSNCIQACNESKLPATCETQSPLSEALE